MFKAIFYKEWLKTRWLYLLAVVVTGSFTVYSLLQVARVIRMRDAAHLWQVMMDRDAVFIDPLTWLPVLAGVLMAIFQFLPEMNQSRLKLTLHLPYPQRRMISAMLLYGTVTLLSVYLFNLVTVGIYFRSVVAWELTVRVLLTAGPWYTAGMAAYYLTSFICLEPTWKRRVVYILLSACVLRIFFLAPAPEAYNSFLPILIVYTFLLSILSLLSVYRFKTGEQD